MAVFRIPIRNNPRDFRQTVSIDANNYIFEFRYNSRNDTWYVNILSQNEELLIEAIPCLTDVINMTNRLNPQAFLTGEIIFIDNSNNGIDCTEENFGVTIGLFYSRPDATT